MKKKYLCVSICEVYRKSSLILFARCFCYALTPMLVGLFKTKMWDIKVSSLEKKRSEIEAASGVPFFF